MPSTGCQPRNTALLPPPTRRYQLVCPRSMPLSHFMANLVSVSPFVAGLGFHNTVPKPCQPLILSTYLSHTQPNSGTTPRPLLPK